MSVNAAPAHQTRRRVPYWFAISVATIYLIVLALTALADRNDWPSLVSGLVAGTGIFAILTLSAEMRIREIRKEVPA